MSAPSQAGDRDALTILHIDTERGWRGGQRQVLWLADSLRNSGHRCFVAARRREPLAEHAAERGLAVISVAPRSEIALASAWRLRRLIRREHVDVVHAHTGHAVALAALAVRRTSAGMVVSRRVIFPLRDNAFTQWKYARADALIAISNAVAESLARSGIDPSRIALVPSGIDLGRQVEPASPGLLRGLGVRDGPLVVMVAALTPEKDPLTFVRAVAAARERHPSLQALLVGDGPLRHAVVAEIDRLGVHDGVKLTGLRPDADRILAAADVVMLTSIEEGLGTVLIDAAHFGKPVVATRVGGIPEIVLHEETGLLAPVREPAMLGDALVRLLDDGELRARLGGAARVQAGHFSMASTIERTIDVYRAVVERRRT